MKRSNAKYLFLVLLLFAIASCMPGCVQTTWQSKGTAIYVGLGKSLKQADNTFQELEKASLVTPEQVTKYNDLYRKAYGVYWAAGDAWKLALRASTDIEMGNYLAAFYKNINEFQALVGDIIKLVNGLVLKIDRDKVATVK